VLVIEDDPSARILMRHALRDVVRTDAAGTVADALRMAETVPYDGLLVDLNLPDGDGTDVVDALRERTPYWGVPMVAVTAHQLPEDRGHFLNAGFDAYVAKPFEKDEIRRLVRHLVVESDEAVDKGRKLVRKNRGQKSSFQGNAEKTEDESDRRDPPATQPLNIRPES
jgi:CheY-like chemotaxis protein